ncbi:hypothetical protein [Thomasclavelia sp.]|uniref:hypothetical protein n=1 Tax=Thomasclavelia sp. TaxID=3025757 RepID=UPI0025F5DB69|nr:hypothetical protein [Thomasclavelia sp.]
MDLLKFFESNYKCTNMLCDETKGLKIKVAQSLGLYSTDCDSMGNPIDCFIDCGEDGETLN